MNSPAPRSRIGSGRHQTIEQFILEQQERFPEASGVFSRLIRDLSLAAKMVSRDIRRAGLLDVTGSTGETNVQGEVQQKLDAIAHAEFEEALRLGGEVALVVSEEADELIPLHPRGSRGRYVVLLDPLDGSSNIDVNVSVGTIFSVFRLPPSVAAPSLEHALRPGSEQVAAGYIVYGSSTMMVFTSGDGVHGFTLDPTLGEFLLSHPNLRIPEDGIYYSIAEGNSESFRPELQRYVAWLHRRDPETNLPHKTRYIGSFIADFHRNLLRGGIYMYPATQDYPQGKLRLMYEANPMAMIVEQAGGLASDGRRRILDIQPEDLHQRTPLYIGSPRMVERAERFLRGEG
ncbi:MAG: class 1 fructose-bisphosphatase [Gemmatimonadetes bacterium]|nr:class 1 fructose-bisphosphatase [Gemmatimonadota bacterium]